MKFFKILSLFRHWDWLITIGEQIVEKEVAVKVAPVGQSVPIASTDADLFGESLSLALTATKRK